MAINTFTASGNIGKDCDSRQTPNGKTIASFSLPVKSGWGEHEQASWVTCKMFGAKAEKLPQYLTKGTKVTVTGSFVLEQWEKDGVQNSRPVILVNDIDFGGSKQGQQQTPQQSQAPAQNQQAAMPADDSFSDEIPF